MNQQEQEYLNLLQKILNEGEERKDRTGVGTKGIFGTQLRFSLKNNTLPLLTTKKMFIKGVVEELLFFIRGETNTKMLEEQGVNIWKGNTSREFLDKRGLQHLPEGSFGKSYGFQWRNFNGSYDKKDGIDQLANVINMLKTNPDDRRMLVVAWNPSQLNEMVLPCCHLLFQFYAINNKLSLQWYQRSVDTFLGLPFNIASYAVLTHIVAQATGMEAEEVIFAGGDTHCYLNHIDQIKEQITREPYDFPILKINKKLNTIQDMEQLTYSDFEISNYKSHSAIKAPMAI